MNNNRIVVIIVIAVIIVAGTYYFLTRTPQTTLQDRGIVAQSPSSTTPAPMEQNVVTYTGNGYSPSTINVKVGTTVTFKNESSQPMWTASGMHPTHTLYPTTGGCIGSTFDACKGIQPGESWSFKFDIDGSWKYHNHLNPSHLGTVIVE